jgi:poly(3-hydroxyalkanoate) synthetase
MAISAGHVGLVVGAKAHATFWPEATRWTAERSTTASAARPAPPAEARPQPARKPARRGNEFVPVWWASNR